MIVRYATRDDLIGWFGEVPATMRAMVVEHDGELLGIAGVSRMQDHLQAFSAIKDEFRLHKFTMAKMAVLFSVMLEGYPVVLAICSNEEPTAPDLLTKLGFTHSHDRTWRRECSSQH